jgi:hypothetical protein
MRIFLDQFIKLSPVLTCRQILKVPQNVKTTNGLSSKWNNVVDVITRRTRLVELTNGLTVGPHRRGCVPTGISSHRLLTPEGRVASPPLSGRIAVLFAVVHNPRRRHLNSARAAPGI